MQKWAKKLAAPMLAAAALVLLNACGGADLITSSEPGRLADHGVSGILLFLALFVIGGATIVPPAILTVAAGVIWPFEAAMGIALAGCMAAAVLGFAMSRYAARDFCSRRIPHRLMKYNEGLRNHGLKTTLILRMLFFLFPPVSWMLGVSRLKFGDYLLGTFFGSLPGIILYTYVGDGLIPWLMADPYPRISAAVAFILASAAAVVLIGRRLKARRGESDQGPTLGAGLMGRSAFRFLKLSWSAFRRPGTRGLKPTLKRRLVMLVFIPAFALLQGVHWLALWLDELLYPSYRSVRVRAPVFIVGVPRSGTTLLHRVMARDEENFTAPRLWELVFAPAVCERKALAFAARMDRRLGHPFGGRGARLAARLTGALDDIHELSLSRPEEDFLLLLPVLSCYMLVAAFPHAPEIENLGYFDARVPESERREIMAFYRGMLQRHLHFHGQDKTLLSKNASFTPMLDSLKSAFPDAQTVICVRPPQETAPSQISSMRGAWSFFGNPADTPEYGERWLKLLEHYYRLLSEFIKSHPGPSVQCVEMHSLKNGLERTVRRLYAEFGLCPGNGFAARLAEEDRVSRSYRSRHVYSLSEYGLDSDTLAARFDGAWTALSAHAASHARRGETETSAT